MYFFRILTVIFVLLFSLSALSFCQDYPPDIARILNKGVIVVAAVKEDIYPFYVHDSKGNLSGIDVALAKDLSSRLGVKVEFLRKAETYDEVVELVSEGRADIGMSYLSRTLNRELRVRFTDPYIVLDQSILVSRMKIAAYIKEEKDPIQVILSEKIKLATLKGSAYVEYAEQGFPNAEVLLYDNKEAIFKGLNNGEFLAVLLDTNSLHNWRNEHPEDVILYRPTVLKGRKDCLSFAVNWKDKHLLRWLNLYIQKIKDDGTLKKLMENYMPW